MTRVQTVAQISSLYTITIWNVSSSQSRNLMSTLWELWRERREESLEIHSLHTYIHTYIYVCIYSISNIQFADTDPFMKQGESEVTIIPFHYGVDPRYVIPETYKCQTLVSSSKNIWIWANPVIQMISHRDRGT